MTVHVRNWLAPTSPDPEVARKQYVLNRVLLGLGGLSLLLWLATVWAWAMGYSPPSSLLYTFVQLPFYALAYALARRRRVRLSAYVLTGILFLTMLAILIRLGVGHSTLTGLALTTVTAGVLIGARPAVILALLCTAAYTAVGLAQKAGELPAALMPADALAADSVALGLALLALVLIVWLSSRQVNRALVEALDAQHQAQAYAQVLEEIREQLLREVDLRTEAAQDLKASLKEQQRLWDTVQQLSVPVIPVHEGVIVTPLVGHIDVARAERLMDDLLRSIEEQNAQVVIMDITGVPVIDSQVANSLIQTALATRLLGAESVLVGVRPDVADTVVRLGLDLSGISTHRDLQAGVRYALTRTNQARQPAIAARVAL